MQQTALAAIAAGPGSFITLCNAFDLLPSATEMSQCIYILGVAKPTNRKKRATVTRQPTPGQQLTL